MDKIIKSFPVEVVKVDSQLGIIDAIVSVIGNIDYGNDVIHPGAFTKTLAERGNKIRVLDNHKSESTRDVIGKPIFTKEIGYDELPEKTRIKYPMAKGGLFTSTQFDMDDEHSKTVFNKLANGYIDEWSIAFSIPKGKQDISKIKNENGEDVTVRNIREVILYEYSPVIWGMNDATVTVASKDIGGGNEEKAQSLYELAWDVMQTFETVYFNDIDGFGYLAIDVYSDNTLLCKPIGIDAMYTYYMVGFEPLEGTYVFDEMADWIGGNFQFVAGAKEAQIDLESKAGRVLSQRNYDKIQNACDMLNDVLASAETIDETMSLDLEENNSNNDLAKSGKPLTNGAVKTIDVNLLLQELGSILGE